MWRGSEGLENVEVGGMGYVWEIVVPELVVCTHMNRDDGDRQSAD